MHTIFFKKNLSAFYQRINEQFAGVYASRRSVYGQRTWSQDSKGSVVWSVEKV